MSLALVSPSQPGADSGPGGAGKEAARAPRQRKIAYVSQGGQALLPALRAAGHTVDVLHPDVGTAAALRAGYYEVALVEFRGQDDLTAETFVHDVFEESDGCTVAIVAIAEGKAAARAFKAGARFVMDHGASPDLVKTTMRSALQLAQSFRRRFARHELEARVDIVMGETQLVGTITEIGTGGMGLTAPTLQVRQVARFEFQLPGMSRAIAAAGVVRWKENDTCGVEFRAFDEGGEQEVANWIHRRETGDDPLPQSEAAETAKPVPVAIPTDPWVTPRKRGSGQWALIAILWVFSLMIVGFWVWMLKS